MDSTQEYPLAAGLLAAFATSAFPTPTSLPSTTPHALSTLASDSGHNHGNEREGEYEWSSLIGIITALAGNVLISLALNIQRYAHIRINKEWEQDKLREELNWKRTHRRQASGSSYGAVEDYEQGPTTGYSDSPSCGKNGTKSQSGRVTDAGDHTSGLGSHLQGSMVSDRTVRPEDQGLRHGPRKSYLRSPYWWAGIILMTLGETGNFMAYGFAPASIVSPLGVVALISNCVIAPFMLKERFRKRDFWGVLIAIAGAVVVVLSAKSSEEKIGPHDIWVMITRWEFELYLGITAALIVVMMWASGKYGSRTILIDVGLVGLFGGYTALSTKGVSSLLSFTWWHAITFPVTYLLAFVLIFSALMQIRYINKALQRFDSTQVIPTQFVLFTLSVIIGSAVLYQDFESFTATRAGKFVGGCLLTFLGVYFITSGRVRADDESSYSTDEEEAIGLLPGERYQDRVDLSPPGPQAQTKNGPRPRTPDLLDGVAQSPPGSVLSRDLEDFDDNQSTPRVALSGASPSPARSLTADSLPEPSPGSSASSRPLSLMRNPWADVPEHNPQSPQFESLLERPSTPPEQPPHKAASSSILFRFPSAPDADGAGVQSLPLGPEGTRPNDRNNTVPQTPPRKARNSISSHFSPGPLFPTLSGGFSAVVANSIRRGEMSPAKDRRMLRRGGRRKNQSTSIVDGILHNPNNEGGEINQDPDATLWDRAEARASTATASANPADGLVTAPVNVGHPTPGEEAGKILRSHSENSTTIARLRSLSDSWSKTVPWLGSVLQKPNDSETGPKGSSADESQAGEGPSKNPDDHQGSSGANA